MRTDQLTGILENLFGELMHGVSGRGGFMLNPRDSGLLRSLERVPELYREALILFYREHQSIENVARELDLTEDAVKQRLSRGRRLLQEEVLSFVETALERTKPGEAAPRRLSISHRAGLAAPPGELRRHPQDSRRLI